MHVNGMTQIQEGDSVRSYSAKTSSLRSWITFSVVPHPCGLTNTGCPVCQFIRQSSLKPLHSSEAIVFHGILGYVGNTTNSFCRCVSCSANYGFHAHVLYAAKYKQDPANHVVEQRMSLNIQTSRLRSDPQIPTVSSSTSRNLFSPVGEWRRSQAIFRFDPPPHKFQMSVRMVHINITETHMIAKTCQSKLPVMVPGRYTLNRPYEQRPDDLGIPA